MEYPSGQFWSAVPAISPPLQASCPPLALLITGAEQETEKALVLCNTVQQELTHWCAINTVLVTNPKQSTTHLLL